MFRWKWWRFAWSVETCGSVSDEHGFWVQVVGKLFWLETREPFSHCSTWGKQERGDSVAHATRNAALVNDATLIQGVRDPCEPIYFARGTYIDGHTGIRHERKKSLDSDE